MLLIIAIMATLILYWIYDGYGRCLQLLVFLRFGRSRSVASDAAFETADWPTMTVLLTVHNEEAVLRKRIQNIPAV
ncbi:MAG: hypothetical protein U0936_25720 [Planctomycetaceae bacterium]